MQRVLLVTYHLISRGHPRWLKKMKEQQIKALKERQERARWRVFSNLPESCDSSPSSAGCSPWPLISCWSFQPSTSSSICCLQHHSITHVLSSSVPRSCPGCVSCWYPSPDRMWSSNFHSPHVTWESTGSPYSDSSYQSGWLRKPQRRSLRSCGHTALFSFCFRGKPHPSDYLHVGY